VWTRLADRKIIPAVAVAISLVAALGCGKAEEPVDAATPAPAPAPAAAPAPAVAPAPAPAVLAGTEAFGEGGIFKDVTDSAGVEFRHVEADGELLPLGAGVIVLDFNSDGLDDIYVANSEGSNALYRNNGDGTFTDVARVAGVADNRGRANGGCAADYDNDGDQDLYLTNYGPSRLFRSSGDGTFADVTAAAGLYDPDPTLRSMGCAWGDYDQDGFLDLVVVRHLHEWDPNMFLNRDFVPSLRGTVLYHSNGDGTFTNVTTLLGDISHPGIGETGAPLGNLWGAGFQPGWVDLDNDGDPDLYVVNDWGPEVRRNVLWRNDGPAEDGTWSFVDISIGSGADEVMFGMGLAVGDYDLDGYFDMFMTNIGDDVLLRNEGNGLRFTKTTYKAGVAMGKVGTEDRVTWGAMFFDYDNDGLEDLYVVSGFLNIPDPFVVFPDYVKEQHNILLRNNGDGTFADVSPMSAADDRGVGRGGAYLDFNNDGCLDLYVANIGQKAKLFQNACSSGNNWLVIETVGTISNRDGIGARINVVAGGTSQIREVSSGNSQMGQSMLSRHFGLGQADIVDFITVRWPSGQVQTLNNVAINQRLIVTEPQ